MKKSFLTFLALAIFFTSFLLIPTTASAGKIKIGKDTGKVIGGMIVGVIIDRAQEKERIRRRERQERSRIRMQEERNRSRIRQEQERREELKRQEALRDLRFQQELELERERQERERRLRKELEKPKDTESSISSTSDNTAVFNEDGSVSFQGINFASVKDFAEFIKEAKK